MSLGSVILQIFNNVKGAGVLTLAAGMAAGRVGWLPATLLCLVLGALAGTTFYLVGAACDLTGEETFKGLWSKAFGESSSWVVDASISAMCFMVLAIYCGILGDVITQLATRFGLASSLNHRPINIGMLSITTLLPLCNVDLANLGFAGILGVAAIGYTVIFTLLRALDGSYALPNDAAGKVAGKLLAGVPPELAPSFERSSLWGFSPLAASLASNLGLSYIAHYNAPAFYRELSDKSAARFAVASGGAFTLLALLNLPMMLLGYATFGDNSAANIISNYANSDALALVGRVATAASLIAAFPLAMAGLKDALFSLRPSAPDDEARYRKTLTMISLATSAALAAAVPDIGPIVGVAGALIGSFIAYILPALLYGSVTSAAWHSPVYLFVPLGVFIAVVGVYFALVPPS
jgi:amino acid permease